VTVLSVDLENSPDMISAVAVSAALAASSIPWQGPVGVVKVGRKDGVYFTNPTEPELPFSEMELVVSATNQAIVMIEAGAKEIPEEQVLSGIAYGQKEAKRIIDLINDFSKEVGVKKQALAKEVKDTDVFKKVKELSSTKIKDLIKNMADKSLGYLDYERTKEAVMDSFDDEKKKMAGRFFDEIFKEETRKMILKGKRPDGRKLDEVRGLSAQVGVLPRTHGSAIFRRGQTQVLTVATLGAPSLEQLIETAEGEETKRYIHHYSMPPYSVGETGRVGWPSRREIGHGALAEKALLPVIPSEDKFPYTIRLVSEILSSNGSTSMAAVCGSTLSLMDAGVPILAPVAGIAMGLVVDNDPPAGEAGKEFAVLTDIVGLEDGNGDMDFKVAGTKKGITALQLDVKTLNLTFPLLEKALLQAKDARDKILEVMLKTLDKPRAKVSTYAPKIKMIKIDKDKIGEVIGPGGRIIRAIIDETGAQIDIEDDGTVSISGMTEKEVNTALEKIEALTKEVVAGEIYEGEVKRIQPFGAFVEILPGKEGLVHVSDMSQDFVKDPGEIVKVGDKIKVRIKEIDDLGRLNLSMLLEGDKKKSTASRSFKHRRPLSKDPRARKKIGRGGNRSSGPHFPASRYLKGEDKNY
jgi:polyribonucleotide nucleotidyltransferase